MQKKKSILNFIKTGILTLFVWVVFIELALRLILPVPFFDTSNVLQVFYPKYKEVKEREITKDNDVYDVLILGGSVVAYYYPIASQLEAQLQKKSSQPVKIHNAAYPAHTTMDSYLKYKNLMEKNFDLVIYYHGINDTRANNCPEEVFKNDYTHYSWYRALHQIENHKELKYTIIPYTLHYTWIYIKEFFRSPDLIHFKDIREEWMDYGENVKTSVSFKDNLTKVIDLANAKNEQVILMSFAYHIAEGYTKEKFLNKELEYTQHKRAIEIWGKPALVEKGIQVHNNIIKEIAEKESHVSYVDQNQSIKKDASNFLDICHLTDKGCAEWARNLSEFINF